MSDSEAIKWLEECAQYFSHRPTNGEDKAHWSNVYNAENALKVAGLLRADLAPTDGRLVSDAQVKHMAQRFLGWAMPEDFSPDAGVHFDPVVNAGTKNEYHYKPVGTNILNYSQAISMVRHMVEGLPATHAQIKAHPKVKALASALRMADAAIRGSNVNMRVLERRIIEALAALEDKP